MAWVFSDSNVEGRLKLNCILGENVFLAWFCWWTSCSVLDVILVLFFLVGQSLLPLNIHAVCVCVYNFVLVQVATSLNSTECFLLQSGSSVFSWNGNQCTAEQQQVAAKLAEFLKVYSIFR